MNPTDIIFQAVSDLTGGLIIDVQTAVIGLVTIGFVLMGLDYIKDLLLSALEERHKVKQYDSLVEDAKLTGRTEDDVYSDVVELEYKAKLNRYSKRYH